MSLEEEIISTKCDIDIKLIVSNNEKFWALINKDIYPNILKVAACFKAFFGSTYMLYFGLCESALFCINVIKTQHRSQLQI